MPLEVSCPSCSGQFRVPDSAAGKKIRCPKCKGVIEVPGAVERGEETRDRGQQAGDGGQETDDRGQAGSPRSKPAPPGRVRPKPEQWFLKTEEGDSYGPVPRDELDAWRAEGRITADCQLLREGTDQWQWAGDVYAELNEDGQPPPANPKAAIAPPSKQKAATKPKQDPADAVPPSTRSRLVAGLLGIFLGPLGTHRFYLGYWVIGLVMLATAGGCGVWSLIDSILIFLGKVPDADGRRLA